MRGQLLKWCKQPELQRRQGHSWFSQADNYKFCVKCVYSPIGSSEYASIFFFFLFFFICEDLALQIQFIF